MIRTPPSSITTTDATATRTETPATRGKESGSDRNGQCRYELVSQRRATQILHPTFMQPEVYRPSRSPPFSRVSRRWRQSKSDLARPELGSIDAQARRLCRMAKPFWFERWVEDGIYTYRHIAREGPVVETNRPGS